MTKERLVAFTDAVLAIIMPILVLELEKPETATFEAFWSLRQNFFAYTLSFFWLASLWIGLNTIWEKVSKVSTAVIWWNMILLFFASFIPYATNLVSTNFNSRVMQGFYGIIVIVMTMTNYNLHIVLDAPNKDNKELLIATAAYRKLLLPDILIKIIGLVLALIFSPPLMMFSVLVAAVFIITGKHITESNSKKL